MLARMAAGVELPGEIQLAGLSTVFFQRFANGGFGSHRDFEIIAMQLVNRPLGDGCHRRLLSFWAGNLLAVCMNNSRDLGESLTERSRSIGMIFGQAN